MTPIQDSNQAKEAVREFFTETAVDYSRLFLQRRSGSNFSFRERLTLATEMTANISGRLLDCACGSGEITAAILASGRFNAATIVDLSPRMLELARQRMAAEVKTPSLDKLEFKSSDIFEFAAQPPTERFNLIMCLGLIAHTGRLESLLASLKPHLAPGGAILLQSTLLDHPGTKMIRALASRRYYRKQGYRISYFRHQDILRAASNVRLEPVAVQRFTFGLPFGDRFFAGMNFLLEQKMRNWARAHGSEALYLLRPAA